MRAGVVWVRPGSPEVTGEVILTSRRIQRSSVWIECPPADFAAARRNASAAIASVKTTCVLWPRSGSNLLASADASVAGPLSPNGGMADVSAAQRSSVPMDALARRGGTPPKKTVKIGSGIQHPLGRFCTPKRSKSTRQIRTKSKLAKIVFHHHLWLGKAREHSVSSASCGVQSLRYVRRRWSWVSIRF